MPKNLIESGARRDPSAVLVAWGRGGDDPFVQVGATLDCTPRPEDREYLFATLNTRQAINDLIRTLRRARDQAFGADA